MMDHRLDALAVLRRPFDRGRAIIEVVANAITREHLWRDESRANVPALITQQEFVGAGFVRFPIFLRRNENRFARRSFRTAKNKRVNALPIHDLHVGQLPGLFFHDDSAENGTSTGESEQRRREKF